jgi:hypothetical protein
MLFKRRLVFFENTIKHMRATCLNVGMLVFLGVWIGGVIALLVGHVI